jgi:hypothetical protein
MRWRLRVESNCAICIWNSRGYRYNSAFANINGQLPFVGPCTQIVERLLKRNRNCVNIDTGIQFGVVSIQLQVRISRTAVGSNHIVCTFALETLEFLNI